MLRAVDRRQFLIATAGLVGGCATGRAAARPGRLDELERAQGGRLGVVAFELGGGRSLAHRADERFPMQSTFKTLLAAAILTKAERARSGLASGLDRPIRFTAADLLEHAPVVRASVGRGEMSVGALCEAAITVSDNAAANLLLADLGGLGPFGAYVRSLGDQVTRLDRIEPLLNDTPGDPRDTTTPRTMAENWRRLFFGDALSPAAREQLTTWHRRTTSGPARLRAGLPPSWALAHKTGTGGHGSTNDVGIVWPPGRPPLVVAAYYAEREAPLPLEEAVLAEVGRLVAVT
jgi:beta-lactamase class A